MTAVVFLAVLVFPASYRHLLLLLLASLFGPIPPPHWEFDRVSAGEMKPLPAHHSKTKRQSHTVKERETINNT